MHHRVAHEIAEISSSHKAKRLGSRESGTRSLHQRVGGGLSLQAKRNPKRALSLASNGKDLKRSLILSRPYREPASRAQAGALGGIVLSAHAAIAWW